MKTAVLGTGDVGRSLATGLLTAGHEVTIAGRSATSAGIAAWLADIPESARARARGADYAGAAATAEVVFLCVRGEVALDVVREIAPSLPGRILTDVTNPLSFPEGKPMELLVANTDSQGEQIQRLLPDTAVVKTLNTVNSHIMTHPAEIPGDHVMPIAGNDPEAKAIVTRILMDDFGWPRVIDLGGIEAARGMEAYLHLWLRLWSAIGHARFNIGINVNS